MGAERPVVTPDDTPAKKAKNRRYEIELRFRARPAPCLPDGPFRCRMALSYNSIVRSAMVIASSRRSGTRTVLMMLGLGVAAAGCGGGSSNHDSGTPSPGAGGTAGISSGGAGRSGVAGRSGSAGQSGGTAGAGGGSLPAGSGGSDVTDGGTPLQDAAPPAPMNTLIFSGTALLIGPGLSCSHAPAPAAGAAAPDKWCGIVRPGATTDVVAMYVVNVTKALAGMPITCAAGDANCLQLTPDLSVDANANHGFFGQTFIYYDKTAAFAWRPGWTAGRKLMGSTATQPVQCIAPSNDLPNAICGQIDVTGTGYDLYAGSIATQAGAALPAVEPVGTGSISFSPDGTGILYSVNLDANSLGETLKMQTIGDDTSRKTVAMNVTNWTFSRDGAHWLWLSAPVNTTISGQAVKNGTLQAAPYPAGTPVVNVQGKVVDYAPLGAKSVVSLSTPTTMGMDLKAVADIDSPTTTTTVLQATNAFALVDVDAAGNILYYDKIDQPDPQQETYLIDLRQVTADGSKKCVVTADTSADLRMPSLIASSKGVAWVQVIIDFAAGTVTSVDGVVTTLADCAAHVFAPEVGSYIDTTTGLVFQNAVNTDQLTADLSYVPLAAGAPKTVTLLQGAADFTIEALTPDLPRVLFTVNQRPTGNGVYVSSALAAGTPALAPVRRTLSFTRPTSSSSLAPMLARGLPAISTARTGLSRFSPFDRSFDGIKSGSARAYARLAVPAMLRRP